MANSASRDFLIWLIQREAIVTVAYPDGKFKSGPKKGQLKYSWAIGSQDPMPKQGDVLPGDTLKAQIKFATDLLLTNIRAREELLNRKLVVDIPQQQYDAFLSVVYRAGSRPLREIGDLFNAGEPIPALFKIGEFIKADGKPNKGLMRRAMREMTIGELGYFGDLSRVPLYEGDPNKVERQMIDASTLEI